MTRLVHRCIGGLLCLALCSDVMWKLYLVALLLNTTRITESSNPVQHQVRKRQCVTSTRGLTCAKHRGSRRLEQGKETKLLSWPANNTDQVITLHYCVSHTGKSLDVCKESTCNKFWKTRRGLQTWFLHSLGFSAICGIAIDWQYTQKYVDISY